MMHPRRQCAAPNQLPDAGPGGTPKGASPALGGGLNAISCLVSGASCVGKRVARVKQVWQCIVMLAVWRRYKLRLLKLLALFSFVDTLADFNAAEQRQHGQQGRVKLCQVECFLAGCFPTVQRHTPGQASSLALAEVPGLFVCRLFAYSAVPYAGPGE